MESRTLLREGSHVAAVLILMHFSAQLESQRLQTFSRCRSEEHSHVIHAREILDQPGAPS